MAATSTYTNSMTPQQCAAFCMDAGFPYSGTEYSSQCFCSSSLPTQGSSSSCNMACAGDSSQICGGPNALSVIYTAPVSTVSTSSKRGLCWPYNNPASWFPLFSGARETWLYNWEMWDPRGSNYPNSEYVGLVHDPGRYEQGQVNWYYTSSNSPAYLLGLNEPDLQYGDPCNVTYAVQLWQQWMEPVKTKYGTKLGLPAVTNSQNPGEGLNWLQQFTAACTGCRFDVLPIHWYGYTLSDFKAQINRAHALYPSLPIWVTEFQFVGHDVPSTQILARQALLWLDSQPFVARYAMFGPMNQANMAGINNGAMITDDGSALTPLGQIYHGVA